MLEDSRLESDLSITYGFPEVPMFSGLETNSVHKEIKDMRVHEKRQKAFRFGKSCLHAS